MLDEFLVINPGVKDSYHFQIVPLYLSLVGKDSILPAQGTTYRFLVQKGEISLIQVIISSIRTVIPFRHIFRLSKEFPQCQFLHVSLISTFQTTSSSSGMTSFLK